MVPAYRMMQCFDRVLLLCDERVNNLVDVRAGFSRCHFYLYVGVVGDFN